MNEAPQTEKSHYETPEIVVYGDVQSITQTTMGGSIDDGAGDTMYNS